MTSLQTATKSQISHPLTTDQRFSLQDFLAKYWLDNASLKDLERFFYETQIEYLSSYSDEELIGEIEDITSDEDFELILSNDNDEA